MTNAVGSGKGMMRSAVTLLKVKVALFPADRHGRFVADNWMEVTPWHLGAPRVGAILVGRVSAICDSRLYGSAAIVCD